METYREITFFRLYVAWYPAQIWQYLGRLVTHERSSDAPQREHIMVPYFVVFLWTCLRGRPSLIFLVAILDFWL